VDADVKAISHGVDAAGARDPLVLAIDIGTSSARALIYDGQGREVSSWGAHRPYAVQTTPDGGVFIDPDRLLDVAAECIDAVMKALPGDRRPAAVAADTFWHSLMGTDESGRPVTPVYTWADTRSSEQAKRLRERLDERSVQARTGCALHSSYWPAKLAWLQKTQPDLVARVSHWMSFGEYLYFRLFGDLKVSLSMASGTGIFVQNTCQWDEELLGVLDLSQHRLSPITDFTDTTQGLVRPFADRWPSLQNVPWYLPLGDGACNNIGSGGCCPDWLVVMIGTSGAIRVVREADSVQTPPGLWTYRVDRRRFVQGGALSDGGNVFAWLTHVLRLPDLPDLEESLAGMQPDGHGLTVLPFLAGERSPDWNPDARSVFAGMTLATRPMDMVRASLEAVAYRFGLVYDVLKPFVPPPTGIIGSGAGLIHSPAWLQIMTDVLGEPLSVSAVPEASSRGAALLVLEDLGAIRDLSDAPTPLAGVHHPDPQRTEIYRVAMERQQHLYRSLMGASHERGPS
jgi:gluconokinase